MSNNKGFDVVKDTLNSKKYISMQETMINLFKNIYKNNDTLQEKYKSDEDFINKIRSSKSAKDFKELLKDTKELQNLNKRGLDDE